ncbi:MAG TPA: CBS domain-containing protein [Phycisphaerae bacterium]|nr:CBS domain-containing protein [Phycisphaerae bacterium]
MQILKIATRDVLTVAPADSIDRAISLMEEHGIHHLVVTDGSKVVGMLSDRDILVSTGWMLEIERRDPTGHGRPIMGPCRIEQIMSRPVETLTAHANAKEAATRLVERKFGALPIMTGNSLVGLVTETDLTGNLRRQAESNESVRALLSAPVREWMRTHVISVGPRCPIADIVGLFRRYRFRHLPVTLEDDILGIVSDRDVRRTFGWSQIHDMQAQEAARTFEGPLLAMEIMQQPVRSIGVSDTLAAALDQMFEHHIHSLPVHEGGRLRGIITQTDFVKAIARLELL